MADDLGNRLISAIRRGDLGTVKSLLDLYGLPRPKLRSQRYHFLCESLLSEQEDIAKHLIERGADVNETKNGLTPLHHAAEKGYIEIIAMLLEKGALVNAKNNRNETPFHRAMQTENLEIIELLLNKMADDPGDRLISAIRAGNLGTVKSLLDLYGLPRPKSRSQRYPFLCESLLSEHEDIAKHLIERGADVNETKNGLSPLHHAAEKGYIEIIAMLLEKDALVNAKNDRNETPLHRAVQTENQEIIELLLNKMADIEAKTKNGMTPLYLAVKLLGRAQISKNNFDHMIASRCKLCISNLKIDSCENAVASPDHRSTTTMDTTDAPETYTSREKVAKLLLDRGADVNAQNNDGKSVLQLAVEQCNFRIIERILLSRPTVNGKVNGDCLRLAVNSAGIEYRRIVELLTSYGFTFKGGDTKHPVLLHNAVRNGDTKIVDTLLKLGANVEAKRNTVNGGTLLHSAVTTGRIEIAELLIKRGANVNAKDKKDKTPILYAIENMDPDMTKLFLTNGAKAESTPSLLHTAAEQGCSHIMEMILKTMPNIDVNAVDNVASPTLRFVDIEPGASDYELTALHVAVAGGFARIIELLLEHNANVSFLAEKVGTPLHCSVLQRDETIVELLLQKGADVDAKLEDGTTPLHVAVIQGNVKAFKLLIKHGADVHQRDNNGLNLVHIATEQDHLKMFEEDLLDVLKAGHPKTNDGLTALHMAVEIDSLASVEILLRHGADASVEDKNGMTPLHLAASDDRHGKIVEAFLNNLDNIDTTDINGHTALHTAVHAYNFAAVRLLVFHGCDVNIKDKWGSTPLKFNKYPWCGTGAGTNQYRFFTMTDELIVKLMALGLCVGDYNQHYINVSFHYKNIYNRYTKEVERMKRTKIGRSQVSFYEFLTTGKRQLAYYSRNRIIAVVLERGDHMNAFKSYGSMIDVRFRKTKIINDLMDSSVKSLSGLSGYRLSDYDYMEIFGYLSRRDLENVIEACANDAKSKKEEIFNSSLES